MSGVNPEKSLEKDPIGFSKVVNLVYKVVTFVSTGFFRDILQEMANADWNINGNVNNVNVGMVEAEHDHIIYSLGVAERPVVEVLVLGHSFIKYLRRYTTSHPDRANMGFKHGNVNVTFMELPRMRHITNAHLAEIQQQLPEIVHIELGTNDLCSWNQGPEVVGSNLQNLAIRIRNLGVRRVTVGQIIKRGSVGMPRGMEFNTRVKVTNRYLEAVLEYDYAIRLWKHKGYTLNVEENLCDDHVHLNEYGMKKYLRSIRGAILYTIKEIRPTLGVE